MKKIKSYTSIWSVEKVIYAINDFQLPFPVTFSQMAWFVLSLFVVILFGELPPFNMIDGAFLKYFGIPVAFTWFVSQKTFDGKKERQTLCQKEIIRMLDILSAKKTVSTNKTLLTQSNPDTISN